MRNLKRALSLVLATVMVIGMMVVGASAASYDDADKISYKEAVDVMTAVGMIKGIGNGDFAPTATIDRAGAAKLIAYLMLGQDVADSIKPTENPFNDVDKNAWYAGYVAYCKSEKLLEGYNGNFDPNGTMTAYGFAKLLLGALGYKADIENLTGDSWEVNTATLAIQNKLFAGNEGALGNAAMTREEAALYAFNALKAVTVYYQGGTNVTLPGGATVTTGATRYNYTNETTDDYRATGGDTLQQLCEKLYPELELDADGTDDFGRNANAWNYDDPVGTYANSTATKTVVSTKNQTLSALLKGINKNYDVPNDTYVDGVDTDSNDVKIGDVVEVYVEKGDVTKTVALTSKLAKITKVTKTTDKDADFTYTVTLKIGTTLKNFKDTALAGFDAETMVKDSYVLVTLGETTAIVSEADVVTGKQTATGTNYVKVDGEKYTVGRVWNVDGTPNYADTYDFYLDANGYVVGTVKAEEAEETVNVFYVKGANTVKGDDFNTAVAQVAVTYLDGTSEILDIAVNKDGEIKLNDKDVTLEDTTKTSITAGFYGYTTNSDGEVTSLQIVGTDGVEGYRELTAAKKNGTVVSVDKNNALVNWGSLKFYASSKTTLTTIKDGAAKTVTGYKNFTQTSFTIGTDEDKVPAILAAVEGDNVTAIYVMDGSMSQVEDLVYGWYVSKGDVYVKDGTTYQDVVYNVNGEDVPYMVKKANSYATFATIKVTDGVAALSAITADAANKHYVDKSVSKVTDTYVIAGSSLVYFAKDVAFYDVTNVADNGVLTTDGVEKNSVVTYVVNSDKEITALYITYGPQEDGVIESNATYITDVLGKSWDADKADKKAEWWVAIQFTTDGVYTNKSLTIKDSEGEEALNFPTEVSTKDGLDAFLIALNTDYTGNQTGNKFPAGEYTYTITGVSDGETVVLSTGSFTVER